MRFQNIVNKGGFCHGITQNSKLSKAKLWRVLKPQIIASAHQDGHDPKSWIKSKSAGDRYAGIYQRQKVGFKLFKHKWGKMNTQVGKNE